MVLETQPWSPPPTVCTYLVTENNLLEISSGSLVKTAVVINPLNNVCRNKRQKDKKRLFKFCEMCWQNSCGHPEFTKEDGSMMCCDFLRHSSGKLLEAGFISPIPCGLNSFI